MALNLKKKTALTRETGSLECRVELFQERALGHCTVLYQDWISNATATGREFRQRLV